MLVKRALFVSLLTCSMLVAADEALPEIEFIEYLGLWEESDEDWILFSDADDTEDKERSDPVPKGEESAENDDES